MDNFFGAGLPVIAFIVGVVCLISTIVGEPYSLGPVTVPAPSKFFQRLMLGLFGAVLVFLAAWPLFSPNTSILVEAKSIAKAIISLFPKPPDKVGNDTQNWFNIGSERIAISPVQGPGASGLYFRNVGTRSVHVQFDAVSDCTEASCHAVFDIVPIDDKSPAAQDATIACAADGHLSFDMPANPQFTWKMWLGAAMPPASC